MWPLQRPATTGGADHGQHAGERRPPCGPGQGVVDEGSQAAECPQAVDLVRDTPFTAAHDVQQRPGER